MNELPPIDVGNYIVVTREPWSDEFIVILPNQDSYALDSETAQKYLHLLKVPEELGFLGYIWNFQAAKLDLVNMQMEPLSMDQAQAYGKTPAEVRF